MIENSILFEGQEELLVKSYNSLHITNKTHKYWENEETKCIRDKIKSFYLPLQNYRCCYCNREVLTSHGRVWDIEHVVPKSVRPEFLFEPKNLAISCIDCNTSKRDTDVLVNKNVLRYPNKSSSFKIVHPHFDIISEHIAIVLDLVYFPKSEKGKFTIEHCGLLRYAYQNLGWMNELSNNDKILDKCNELMSANDKAIQDQKIYEILIMSQIKVSRTLL